MMLKREEVTETELREAGRPESILELAGGIDRRLTRLNEILETGFQDLTLPEVNERLEEFAEIRAQLAPLEEQARDLIRADPSLVAGGEETQAALDQSLGNILKIFELFVASLQTRVRSLDEANRATITLERQFAQAVAGQIQARFRVGIGVLDEFITAQKELIAATRASNVARVDSNVQGIQAAEDFSRVQTQGLFTSVPGLIGQQAEFNIKEESATIQEITAERQTQLEIQMQAGQSALSLITQERQFLDFQRTSLQEQTTLIEREGQLRQEQNTATRENLVLQAADRAERLEVLERELAQTTGALATTRRTFLATPEGVDVVALEEFDQGAEIALNTITSAISELRNELDTLNGSITNTQAAAEVLANQTARDVRELISNRPEIALQNQQEQDDIALATLRRATIERQLQLELRNREGQIVLDTINSDLAYLQSRGTDLNEQIALVELRGQLQTVLAERELESLRLQRFEAEQRRDIIQEQINLFETAAAQSRETLVTDPQTPPAQIIAFDARTTRDLSTLKDTFSGVVGDIDRTNAALSETSAAIRQVGVDTARTVEDISTVTINLGETIREALSQFAIGLARGTTDLDQLAGRLADSIEASFISGFTEALTAKLDFDQKIMKNLADLSGVFTNFADFIGGILSGIFGTAGVATEQFGRGAVEVFNAIFRSGAPAGGAVAATGPTAVVPAAPEAAPVSGAASAASAAVLNSAENAAEHSSEATQAANQAAQAAGTTVAVVAQAQSTILSGLANIGESLLGVARLVTQQVGTSLGAEAGGGSNAARVGAQIGDAAGSAIGTAAGAAVSTAFNLAGTFLGNVLGPLGGILGGLAGSFIGGLLGGLFAPGRIALEKRAIRRDLRQGLSFDPEFGSGYVGTTDPDRRALEAIGTFRALDEIRKNDERGQGTVQRYVNQAIHAFQNANLTVEQRQQEIFRLAEQNGLDNPVNVLQTFRVFDREHGLDEIIESREEGLEEGNLITRADILSGAIDIYAQFDERINSVAIANSFLADAFAKLRPEAMETIAGIRDGSILLEDALIALGVSEGEISEVFDDETFLEFLALAQVGVDALTKEVEDLTLALEGIEITRAQIQVQRVRVLQDLGGATAGEAIPFLESQRDAFRMVAELEESRIIPADELDFTDPEAVDRNLSSN